MLPELKERNTKKQKNYCGFKGRNSSSNVTKLCELEILYLQLIIWQNKLSFPYNQYQLNSVLLCCKNNFFIELFHKQNLWHETHISFCWWIPNEAKVLLINFLIENLCIVCERYPSTVITRYSIDFCINLFFELLLFEIFLNVKRCARLRNLFEIPMVALIRLFRSFLVLFSGFQRAPL